MINADYDRLMDLVVKTIDTTTLPQQAHRLAQFVARDVTFRDPRLSARGRDELTAAIASLFDGAESMAFRVTDRAWGQDERTVYLRWDRLVKLPLGNTHAYSGVTEMMFGMDGKIASIVDTWNTINQPRQSYLSRWFKR